MKKIKKTCMYIEEENTHWWCEASGGRELETTTEGKTRNWKKEIILFMKKL